VPNCEYTDFLSIFDLTDNDQSKAEWAAWQGEQQEYHRLLQEAGFQPVDTQVTGQSYQRFIEEYEEMVPTEWSVWLHAGQITQQDTEQPVHSISALLISTWDLDEFPCIGGSAVDEPTLRVETDMSTKQAELSILMADPEKRGTHAFQKLGTLDLSDAPHEVVEQLAAGEVPWYACVVQRDQDGGWTVEFSTAETEEELYDTMSLNSIQRVLRHLVSRR
jgi:hypothetical protein